MEPNCPYDGKVCWSSGCFFQHGFNKICSKLNFTVATDNIMVEPRGTWEADPEVQAWLKTVSESDYDLVSKDYQEIRYNPGTKAKMLLHKSMQAYADQQCKAERNKAIDDCIKVLETYVCDIYLIPILESLKLK